MKDWASTPKLFVAEADIQVSAHSMVRIFETGAAGRCEEMIQRMAVRDPSGAEVWQRILKVVRSF
jgi:hypothetical protein